MNDQIMKAQSQVEEIELNLIGNKQQKEKSGLAVGYQKPLISTNPEQIAEKIKESQGIISEVVTERDMPLLMNDTIFNKILKDCKAYMREASRSPYDFASELIFIHSASLKSVCYG